MKILLAPIILIWRLAFILPILAAYATAIAAWVFLPLYGASVAPEHGNHRAYGLLLGVIGAAIVYRLLSMLSSALFAIAGGEGQSPFNVLNARFANPPPELQRAAEAHHKWMHDPANPVHPANPWYDDDKHYDSLSRDK